jgi:hypothetical protein
MSREWVSLSEAGRRLGGSARIVRRLADRSQLTIRQLPGCHPKVPLVEVEELARLHTQAAGRNEPVRLEPVSAQPERKPETNRKDLPLE